MAGLLLLLAIATSTHVVKGQENLSFLKDMGCCLETGRKSRLRIIFLNRGRTSCFVSHVPQSDKCVCLCQQTANTNDPYHYVVKSLFDNRARIHITGRIRPISGRYFVGEC
jgi:hypothetical protein